MFLFIFIFLWLSMPPQKAFSDQNFCKLNPDAPQCQFKEEPVKKRPKPYSKPKKNTSSTPKVEVNINTIKNHNTNRVYTSLQRAIDESNDGDLIVLGAGTYKSNKKIEISDKRNLNIAGTPKKDDESAHHFSRVRVNPLSAVLSTNPNEPVIEIANSSNITIYDIYFSYEQVTDLQYDPRLGGAYILNILNSDNIYIKNNFIGCEKYGYSSSGFFIEQSNKITLEQNYIANNKWNAIWSWDNKDINILDNYIFENGGLFKFDKLHGYLSIKDNDILMNGSDSIEVSEISDLAALNISNNFINRGEHKRPVVFYCIDKCSRGGGGLIKIESNWPDIECYDDENTRNVCYSNSSTGKMK